MSPLWKRIRKGGVYGKQVTTKSARSHAAGQGSKDEYRHISGGYRPAVDPNLIVTNPRPRGSRGYILSLDNPP
jgi:hypothetical protein